MYWKSTITAAFVFIAMFASLAFTFIEAENIKPVPNSDTAMKVEPGFEAESIKGYDGDIANIALVQDRDPWGITAIKTILTANSIPYTVLSSSDIGTADLSSYDRMVIPSVQTSTFYSAMSSNQIWFEDWISAGGVMIFLGAAYSSSPWTTMEMPCDIEGSHNPDDTVYLVDPNHDMLNVPNVITEGELASWNSSYHDILTAPAATAIINDSSDTTPVLMHFQWGSGDVIVTGMTLEWGYNKGYSLLLENVLLAETCSGCKINDECYGDGETNPDNVCLICDLDESETEWTDNDGVACDDQLWCTGTDTCDGGTCSVHTGSPCEDDGYWCTGDELCDEDNDECVHEHTPVTRCPDDGVWCNGNEACDEANDACVSEYLEGQRCADDGLICNGVESCDEASDQCITENVPECQDDGDFCNGAEICDELAQGCISPGDPCSSDEACNEETDSCDPRGDADDDADDDASDGGDDDDDDDDDSGCCG